MSTLSNRRAKIYRLYLVQPVGDFAPTNWIQKPNRLKIVRRIATTNRLGKADAQKFTHNHAAIANRTATDGWFVIMAS